MGLAQDIARSLGAQAETFCRTYLPNGRQNGNYWQVGDVTGAPGDSLAVLLHSNGGRPAGRWNDYATGEGGDLLNLLLHVTNARSFREAIKEARTFLREPEIVRSPAERTSGRSASTFQERREKAERLFSRGQAVAGTPAHRYLQNRSIERLDPALAYHSECYFRDEAGELQKLPALLARISDNEGRITGVAKTWLDAKRGAKADIQNPKRVMGHLAGNAVRFGRPGTILGCGEGIETLLSVGTALPNLPLAACLTATHLGLFEVPQQTEKLWVFRDNDEAGVNGFYRLSDRLAETRRKVEVREIVPLLNDWNDDLTTWGVQAVRSRLLSELGSCAAAFA